MTTVDTNQPTNIADTSITLNGTLNDLQGNSSLDVYFEWSFDDTSYNYQTEAQTLSSVPQDFSADIFTVRMFKTGSIVSASTISLFKTGSIVSATTSN